MNASDYGGGTPIVDVWRKDVGIAVGHVEARPLLISLPVSMPGARHAQVSVQYRHDRSIDPGESFHTFRTFVTVHQGDYFETLLTYRRFMVKQGFRWLKPRQRLWSDLVRVGLRAQVHASTGIRHVAHREAYGLQMGHAR